MAIQKLMELAPLYEKIGQDEHVKIQVVPGNGGSIGLLVLRGGTKWEWKAAKLEV